jgi:Asp-tRNA(Asn)/Glu-tRNA(Gln) amidotransferase A subunit family amidase
MVPESTSRLLVNEVGWLGAAEIGDRVRRRAIGRAEVAGAVVKRIDRLDQRIHSFVTVEPQISANDGLLAGVPIGVKDTQPVAGMRWTSGSLKWRDRVADHDAVPVARARAAGATIVGKTNTPELASNPSTINDLFPATENPWRAGFTPGGSSGGSAAAVAAGLCTIAIGDDYGGSVRIPAACCGVLGYRPTPGDFPEEVPDAPHINSRGPLARSVADLRLAFEVMAGVSLPGSRLGSLRIALVLGSGGSSGGLHLDAAGREATVRAADALRAHGHSVEEVTWDPLPCLDAYHIVRRVSFGALEGEPAEYGEWVAAAMTRGRDFSGVTYFRAVQEGTVAARRLLQDRFESGYDAFLTPTLGFLPMPIEAVPAFFGEQWNSQNQFLLPVSFSGLPSIAMPAGLHDGIPVSVQLVGRYRHDGELLDLAAQLESSQGFGFEKPPTFD